IETVDNAKEAGVKHFVIVSSIGAGDPKNADQIKHYMYAKHRADDHPKASGLNYTIIRPPMLQDEAAAHRANSAEGEPELGHVPREDVAAVLAHEIDKHQPANKVYNLTEGDTPVDDSI